MPLTSFLEMDTHFSEMLYTFVFICLFVGFCCDTHPKELIEIA